MIDRVPHEAHFVAHHFLRPKDSTSRQTERSALSKRWGPSAGRATGGSWPFATLGAQAALASGFPGFLRRPLMADALLVRRFATCGSRFAAASPGPFRETSRDVVASPSCAAFLDVLSPASRQVVLPQRARDVPRQAFGLAPSREGRFAVLPDDHLPPEAVARLVAQLARHDMVVAD